MRSQTGNRQVGFLTNRHVAVDLDYPNQKMFHPLPPTLGPGIYLGAVERATSFITDELWYGIFAGINPGKVFQIAVPITSNFIVLEGQVSPLFCARCSWNLYLLWVGLGLWINHCLSQPRSGTSSRNKFKGGCKFLASGKLLIVPMLRWFKLEDSIPVCALNYPSTKTMWCSSFFLNSQKEEFYWSLKIHYKD